MMRNAIDAKQTIQNHRPRGLQPFHSTIPMAYRRGTRVLLLLVAVTTGVQAFSFASAAAASPPESTTTIFPQKPCELSSSTRLYLNDPSDHAAATAGDAVVTSKNNNAYQLIWSPGHWKKFIYTAVSLVAIPPLMALAFGGKFSWLGPSSSSCHPQSFILSIWSNLALPLVASSCCLLQLALNVLAVGCAGWNKILGPVRPYFLAWLLVVSVQPPLASRWTLMGRATVALLPEALDWYNNHGREIMRRTNTATNPVFDTGKLGSDIILYEITLDLPTMGCVACIHSVNGALQQVPGVVRAKSQLNPSGAGGSAKIQIPNGDSDHIQQQLIQAVSKAGFPGATMTRSVPMVTPPKNNYNEPETIIAPMEEETVAPKSGEQQQQILQVTLDIPTMGCGACIDSINGALQQVPGVRSAESQLHPLGLRRGGSAMVLMEAPPSDVGHEQLLRALADAGYDGATIVATTTT